MEESAAVQSGERVKQIRNRCKKLLGRIEERLTGDSQTLLDELSLSRPAVQALMDLVLDFQAAYAKEKDRRGLLDFSDLEHFAEAACRWCRGADGAGPLLERPF